MTAQVLLVRNPGPLSVVQDRGRFGWEHLGIARGGAGDVPTFIWANRLALNEDDAAVIEMTLLGITVSPSTDVWVATTGASEVYLDGQPRPPWSAFRCLVGSLLEVRRLEGARGYLAVHGGIDVEPVLGSRSTNLECSLGGFEGRSLQPGDTLPLAALHVPMQPRDVLRHPQPSKRDRPLLATLLPGRGGSVFIPEALETLVSAEYVVSPRSNHIGIRMSGTPIPAPPGGTRVSEPVAVGAIEITPAGEPIVLLAARGTIGGYPVLATATQTTVWALSQMLPGERVRFSVTDARTARQAAVDALRNDLRFERDLV